MRRTGQNRVKNPLYSTYTNMKSRCYTKTDASYKKYGALGITICDRWLGPDGFEHFIKDMGERPAGHSIDRIDGKKGYSPDNCRWASNSLQLFNRRTFKKDNLPKGIQRYNDSGKFRAYIGKDKITETIGVFDTVEEAVKARKEMELKYYGENVRY